MLPLVKVCVPWKHKICHYVTSISVCNTATGEHLKHPSPPSHFHFEFVIRLFKHTTKHHSNFSIDEKTRNHYGKHDSRHCLAFANDAERMGRGSTGGGTRTQTRNHDGCKRHGGEANRSRDCINTNGLQRNEGVRRNVAHRARTTAIVVPAMVAGRTNGHPEICHACVGKKRFCANVLLFGAIRIG